VEELNIARDILKKWYAAFPLLKLCTSNHGNRWLKRAIYAELPTQLIRSYKEVIQAPETWTWQKYWRVEALIPFMLEHGDDWGGQMPHKQAALHNGRSTVIGHFHSLSGVEHIKTAQQKMWGMVVGSLIDFDQICFTYARKAKLKPVLSAGLVLDGGKSPVIIPYE